MCHLCGPVVCVSSMTSGLSGVGIEDPDQLMCSTLQLLPNLRPGYVELARSIEVVASSNSSSSGLHPASGASAAVCASSAVSVSPAGLVTDEDQPASASEDAAAASGSEAGGSDAEDAGSGDEEGAAAATSPVTPAAVSAAEAPAAKQGRKQGGDRGVVGTAAAAPGTSAAAGVDAAAEAEPAPAELAAAEGDEQTPVAVAKVRQAAVASAVRLFRHHAHMGRSHRTPSPRSAWCCK